MINGGTANINADIKDASTTVSSAGANNTTLTLDGGTLNMSGHNIGTYTAPITTINLNSGGKVTVRPAPGAVDVCAGALPATGSTAWGCGFGSCGTVAWIRWMLALEPQPASTRALVAIAARSLIA